MKEGEKVRIVVGSCDVYVSDYDGKNINEANIIETVCVKEKRFAHIKGGASVEYKPTSYTAKDDKGLVSKTVLTDEDAIVKSGFMTISPDMLNILTSTGRVEEITSKDKKYKSLKIGGINNFNGKYYVIVLHHQDKIDGDIYVIIVGNNEAGFTLNFQKDKETVVDAEFKAHPSDDEGTLITYLEEVVSPTEPVVAAEG